MDRNWYELDTLAVVAKPAYKIMAIIEKRNQQNKFYKPQMPSN